MEEQRRLVAFAPSWYGSQEGAVGFQEQGVQGGKPGRFLEVGGIFKGDDPGDRDIKPKLKNLSGQGEDRRKSNA